MRIKKSIKKQNINIAQEFDLPPGDPNRQAQQRYFTSSFETQQIELPRVGTSNFVWHLLGIGDTRLCSEIWPCLEREWSDLCNANDLEFNQLSTGVAAVYSLATSCLFNQWNISGRGINLWVNE